MKDRELICKLAAMMLAGQNTTSDYMIQNAVNDAFRIVYLVDRENSQPGGHDASERI